MDTSCSRQEASADVGGASSCHSQGMACAEATQTQLQLGHPGLVCAGWFATHHTPPRTGTACLHSSALQPHPHGTTNLVCYLWRALTLSLPAHLHQLPHLVMGSPVVAQLHAPCIDQHAGRFRVPVVQIHSSRDLGGLHHSTCRGERKPVQTHPRRDPGRCAPAGMHK